MESTEQRCTCIMDGCDYDAEYDGWCKWCMLVIDPDRVVEDYPELGSVA